MDLKGRKVPVYAFYTTAFVKMMATDLQDSRNQGPNFDAKTFPIAKLAVAFLRSDEFAEGEIRETDLEKAGLLAVRVWSKIWGLDPGELTPEEL